MYKYILLFVVSAAVAAPAPNDLQCPCQTTIKERDELFEFMKNLSFDVNDEEEKKLYSALPGQLSPMLDCDCEEYNRKKRKVVEVPEIIEEVPEIDEEKRAKKSVVYPHRGAGNCPESTMLVGNLCLPMFEDY